MSVPYGVVSLGLIRRAIDALEEHGDGVEIDINANATTGVGHLKVCVSGHGIPEEAMRDVFLPPPIFSSGALKPWTDGKLAQGHGELLAQDPSGFRLLAMLAADLSLWEAFRLEVLATSEPTKAGPDA